MKKIFPKSEKYDPVSMIFHWAVAALVLFMLWFGHYVSDLPKGSIERLEGFQLHFSFGIVILVLVLLRLFWRLTHRAPPLVSSMKAWEKFLAKTMHYLFYAALILMPLAGWATATTSSLDVPIRFFDLFQFPWFPGLHGLETREIVHEVFEEMHKTTGWIILGLFGVHFLAVLYHSLIQKDGTLKRMLPGK